MPNNDKKMREMMRTRNPDIDPRENRFNPDARGYMEMMYDMIDPAALRQQPQMDPRLDAIMRMFSQRVG